MTMQSVYRVVNDCPSHLIIWGNPFDCNGRDVIVLITGNPGIADFYQEFGSELHKHTTLPVCIVGHAGHEDVPGQEFSKLRVHDQSFTLKGQIDHKLDIFKNHIDKNSGVHIIAHSIGAWMTIELMDKNNFLQDKVLSINLLFPTIQKMAESKNGIFFNKTVRRLHLVIILLAYFFSFLPDTLIRILVKYYIKFYALPSYYCDRIYKLLNPKTLENVLLLTYEEIDTVTKLNLQGVKKLCLQTNIIYSIRDNWAPVHYIEDLKSVQPSFEMNKVNFSHGFVLKSSENVARIVSKHVKPKINKK